MHPFSRINSPSLPLFHSLALPAGFPLFGLLLKILVLVCFFFFFERLLNDPNPGHYLMWLPQGDCIATSDLHRALLCTPAHLQ